MSGFEDTLMLAAAASVGAALMVSALVLVSVSWRRQRRLRDRLKRLEEDLGVFTEASTRVAQTLEQVLLDRVTPGQSVHTSRRYLLQQARERLAQGDSLATVARGLGLSDDEAALLGRRRAA